MPTKKTAPRKSAEQIRENIDGLRDRLLERHNNFPQPTDTSSEALEEAVGVWVCYPHTLADIGVFDDQPSASNEFETARFTLLMLHRKATALLMQRAESLGIPSGPIHTAAALKEELFKRDPKRYFHNASGCTWPACLGAARWELTPDQQSIVTRAEDAVQQLAVKAVAKPQEPHAKRTRRPSKNDEICEFVHKLRSKTQPVKFESMPGLIQKQFSEEMTADAIGQAYRRWEKNQPSE